MMNKVLTGVGLVALFIFCFISLSTITKQPIRYYDNFRTYPSDTEFGKYDYSNAVGDSIQFPVEVIGPDDYIQAVTVSASNGALVDRLFLKTFNIAYAGEDNPNGESKGWVRVNSGSWIELNNTNATCLREYEREWGCISLFPVVQFTIPVSGIANGNNLVEFQFRADLTVKSANAGHGYLVLDIAWMESGGTFQRDYVRTDVVPSVGHTAPGGSNVAGGKTFFTTFNVQNDDGFGVNTTCESCHSHNGSAKKWPGVDLALFNFSPKTVNQVVLDRGGTQQNADDTVAWILSLKDSMNTANTFAVGLDSLFRPWTALYQGCNVVNTDTMAVEYWAASGGIYTNWGYDCIVADDEDMQASMFRDTGGIINWKSASLHPDSIGNFRQTETPIPTATWHFWLPRADLDAMYPGTPYADFEASAFFNSANTAIPNAIIGGNNSAIQTELNNFWLNSNDFISSNINNYDPLLNEKRRHLSIAQFQVAKTFEFMYFDKLEEISAIINNNPTSPNIMKPQKREWLGTTSRVMFDLSIHITGADNAPVGKEWNYGADSTPRDLYHDTYPYELQCGMLNAGHGQDGSFRPCDWKYTFSHLKAARQFEPLMGVSFRLVREWAHLQQMASNGDPNTTELSSDYFLRHTSPHRLFGNADGSKFGLGATTLATRNKLVNETIRAAIYFLYPLAANKWTCDSSAGNYTYFECAGYQVTAGNLIATGRDAGAPAQMEDTDAADSWYRTLLWLEHMGADASLMDSVAHWQADSMGWVPAVGERPYSDFFATQTAPAVPIMIAPTNGAIDVDVAGSVTWNAVSGADDYQIQIDDNIDFSSPVVDETTVSLSSAYILSFASQYHWRIRANNSFGTSAWSEIRTFNTQVLSIYLSTEWATSGSIVEGTGQIVVTGSGKYGTIPATDSLNGFLAHRTWVGDGSVYMKVDSVRGTASSLSKTVSLMAIDVAQRDSQFVSIELAGNNTSGFRIRMVKRETKETTPAFVSTLQFISSEQGVCLKITRIGTSYTGKYKTSGDCAVDTGYTSWGAVTLSAMAGNVEVGIFASGVTTGATATAIGYISNFTIE